MDVGAATLKSAAAVARCVVRLRAQNVFSGDCEFRGRGCLSLCVGRWTGIFKGDVTRPTEFTPHNGTRRAPTSSQRLVVAYPQRQRKRFGNFRYESSGDSMGRSGER